jgi:hypothetical protein
MISSFLPDGVHWQAIGPLLRVGARYIFVDQLLGLARLMNPAPLLRYWSIFFLQRRGAGLKMLCVMCANP